MLLCVALEIYTPVNAGKWTGWNIFALAFCSVALLIDALYLILALDDKFRTRHCRDCCHYHEIDEQCGHCDIFKKEFADDTVAWDSPTCQDFVEQTL
jgi:hypothetical protein